MGWLWVRWPRGEPRIKIRQGAESVEVPGNGGRRLFERCEVQPGSVHNSSAERVVTQKSEAEVRTWRR